VAGYFYPDDPRRLRSMVAGFLADAPGPTGEVPKALIAPHAGYRYSGRTAGRAWATVAPARGRIRRVVLAGPAHRVALRGIGVPGVDMLDTPLGPVRVDESLRATALGQPGVVVSDAAHAEEHSLEVHLPFLIEALGDDVTVLPLVVGRVDAETLADVLDAVWGGDETLVVASTDLSHYHDDATARRIDRETVDHVLGGRVELITHDRACGAGPLRGLLLAADRHGLVPSLLEVCTSADTAGTPDRVVGYGAFALAPALAPPHLPDLPTLGAADAEALLWYSVAAVRSGLERRPVDGIEVPASPALNAMGATFVTLERGQQLLGCIGTLEAMRPLYEDAMANAYKSAFADPRLPAVTADDYRVMDVKVSVLSPLIPMNATTRDELEEQLEPGVDGVLLVGDRFRATFLPSVWPRVASTSEFVSLLLRKGGRGRGDWVPGLKAYRYRTSEYSQPGPRPPVRVSARSR
jgi:AmmeMemoRadiSam system protein B/AmmeMemoRadiSam system protein A